MLNKALETNSTQFVEISIEKSNTVEKIQRQIHWLNIQIEGLRKRTIDYQNDPKSLSAKLNADYLQAKLKEVKKAKRRLNKLA